MYCCAHKTATLTPIQHTVEWGARGGGGSENPPKHAYVLNEWSQKGQLFASFFENGTEIYI